MRTTITLDADVEALVAKAMRERRESFKLVVNAALREALGAPRSRADYSFQTFQMGSPRVDLTQAMRLAADLEDEERVRRLEVGR